jgi:hypothetical protein
MKPQAKKTTRASNVVNFPERRHTTPRQTNIEPLTHRLLLIPVGETFTVNVATGNELDGIHLQDKILCERVDSIERFALGIVLNPRGEIDLKFIHYPTTDRIVGRALKLVRRFPVALREREACI